MKNQNNKEPFYFCAFKTHITYTHGSEYDVFIQKAFDN